MNLPFFYDYIWCGKIVFILPDQDQSLASIINPSSVKVRKRDAHIEQMLLMDKCSYQRVITLSSDVFKMLAIPGGLTFGSPSRFSPLFFMFSGTTTKFGRPERSALSVSLRKSFLIKRMNFLFICTISLQSQNRKKAFPYSNLIRELLVICYGACILC